MGTARIKRDDLFATLPPEWPDDPLPAIQAAVKASGQKVVVLDDDPTGTQTVHGIPVLTEWPVEMLCAELTNDLPAVYLLTNSRSMPLAEAQKLNTEIGRNLVEAVHLTGRRFVVASRSDSTLRGHFPGEVNTLAEALGGSFDAVLLTPAFMAGGRYTIGDVHYVADGDWLIPAGETEFARDAVFGYTTSDMRRWVEAKTQGRIPATYVASISLDDIRTGGADRVTERLLTLDSGRVCVINAASERDLAVAALGVIRAEQQGKRFLYRTAASFVAARAGIMPRPLLIRADLNLPEVSGGLIVVGSYVPKTSGQLEHLLENTNAARIEVPVEKLLDDTLQADEIKRAALDARQALADSNDVVIYTSRKLITGDSAEHSLSIGRRISESLVAIVRAVPVRPRYLLAKGGITSSDTATKGLGVKRAMVVGQILPGVPVWQLGAESRWPEITYIVFPGNVGDHTALTEVVSQLCLL